MSIRRKRIELLVQELLQQNNIVAPPVNVEQIVNTVGIIVRKKQNKDSDISGFLFRDNKKTVIGVNSSNSLPRQRFTVAHELGHYLLHSQGDDGLYVDRGFEVMFRDDHSSDGINTEEREANLFAAELLMPELFLREDLAAISGLDLVDDVFIKQLARKYKVSFQAMLFRLTNLQMISI